MYYDANAPWSNYHKTVGAMAPDGSGPQLIIESLAKIVASDSIQPSGLVRFSTFGVKLFEHLAKIEAEHPVTATSPRIAAGIVGAGWSFAPLIGTPILQLLCDGLSTVTELMPDEWHPLCKVPADHIVLAGGGTLMTDVALFAEQRGRTLITSGSYLGPTIAGAFATSSHGSRLHYGGIQNMVLGMHLIVGKREHVWIERRSSPVLDTNGLVRLTIDGVPPRLVQDDDKFEDALIHLGAMGIVNGVALNLTENRLFTLLQRVRMLTPDFLRLISAGDFRAVAAQLGCQVDPSFYELTLNPQHPFDDEAMHTMYIPTAREPLMPPGDANIVHPADAIAMLGAILVGSTKLAVGETPNTLAAGKGQKPIPPFVMRRILKGADSAFSFYRNVKPFEQVAQPFDPEDPFREPYRWSGLHGGGITGGSPGALYNASFAVPLDRVADAVPAICAAVADLLPSFVFTLRFVEGASGTLTFTRFEYCAVIEIDGLSPLICALAKATADPNDPYLAEYQQALDELAVTMPTGAAAVRDTLEAAGIPYSMHWAKLGDLDKDKVYADYGRPTEPDSLIRRWRETRDDLLPDFGRAVFWNDAVVTYGLIDL